jgi:hypothetical protein
MTPAVAALATQSGCAGSVWRPHPISPNLPLKSRSCRSQRVSRNVLVDVNRLRMLAEIVQAGEPARAVTLEWSFASVFPARGGSVISPVQPKTEPPESVVTEFCLT